jgi:hypothetical protein
MLPRGSKPPIAACCATKGCETTLSATQRKKGAKGWCQTPNDPLFDGKPNQNFVCASCASKWRRGAPARDAEDAMQAEEAEESIAARRPKRRVPGAVEDADEAADEGARHLGPQPQRNFSDFYKNLVAVDPCDTTLV